jgi:hypothetical protein
MKFPYLKTPQKDPNKPFVARPYLPVSLISGTTKTASPYYALLDSGADSVMFPEELAPEVGITDITRGRHEQAIGIAGQTADVYYHTLHIEVLGDGRRLLMEVGFSKKIFIPILGRTFFRHFKTVAFSEAQEEIELKP